ncbi:MAG: acyl-CoA dehydrogenase [Porticoccaceae bacterium]|jgi:acyl-CoA dehydrogenase|nr:acyl-CoA dehydrogenase [Porticoccaceae bacterium]MEA3299253.1 acyl-CoA dehydrogenase [Pseudomonadota bacterium]HLS97606.1 acyl-CoA dehydrogenase [Porticoccaceae bacterium]
MTGLILLIVALIALAFLGANLVVAAGAMLLATLAVGAFKLGGGWVLAAGCLSALVLGLLAAAPLRRRVISDPALGWFRKVLPKVSDTEQEALDAGTVWWDAELFSGQPNWNRLLTTPKPRLRDDEQAFLDGPVEDLCRMLDDWQIHRDGDLPPAVWQYLKDQRFFSLIIDKQYGGRDFSAFGNSAVVMKLASRNLAAAITVMVPNSLGPGELLSHFGTEAQRDHYLPRLARGEDIPCFALTAPAAGSDAAAMPDEGVVCYGDWQGERVLGLRLNWNKRYITLAPVATLIGLAFKTRDPDGLLGGEVDLGISCALIPASAPGVWTGNRHRPVGSAFMNGPTRGENVFIPLDQVIGGRERIGQGWRMLMHCLAAGRAISLPALGTAGAKLSARYSGEYARIRKQFGMPIAYFEGVEEVLARIAGEAYRIDAARHLTLSALALGEKPSVLSAILKWHATEANRRCVNDAMDIHGGKGIITGPRNYLAGFYQALPIAITVEGANILTRSLIIFGQGAVRNHPFLLKEMALARAEENEQVRATFDSTLFRHVGFTLRNLARAFVLGITGARLVKAPVAGRTAHYYRQLTRLSAAFAFVADMVLLSLGGAFKFREKISGRLADVLTHLYLASAVLKYHEDNGCPKEDHPLVHWAVRDSLFQIQNALVNTLRNFPIRPLGLVIQWLIFPLGRPYKEPSDNLGKHAARLVITDCAARERLTAGIFLSEGDDVTAILGRAFKGVLAIAPLEKALRKQLGESLSITNYEDIAARGLAAGLISEADAEAIRTTMALVREVIDVDDFPPGDGAAG